MFEKTILQISFFRRFRKFAIDWYPLCEHFLINVRKNFYRYRFFDFRKFAIDWYPLYEYFLINVLKTYSTDTVFLTSGNLQSICTFYTSLKFAISIFYCETTTRFIMIDRGRLYLKA